MRRAATIFVFCLSAGVGLALTPNPAEAHFRRISGTTCSVDKQSAGLVRVNSLGVVNETQSNNQLYTTCGIPSDDFMRHDSITQLNVHGFDNTTGGNVVATACVTFFNRTVNGLGAVCGNTMSTTNAQTGFFALSPEVSALTNNAFDFPHLFVLLPGFSSYLAGFFVSSP
jgi:hypothetical protein